MNGKKLFSLLMGVAISLGAVAGCGHNGEKSSSAPTTEPAQATFSSPDQAAQALVDAVRSDDQDRLKQILGPGADQLLASGDEVEDKQNRQKFLDSFDARHSVTVGDNGEATLTVGTDDWPMPIPIVKDDKGAWYFNTDEGTDEILNRRIGKNELSAIQVCLAIVDAEKDYEHRDPDGTNVPAYASKIISDPGQKNGLYWPTTGDEPESPLGPLVAGATDEGYPAPSAATSHQPYHGYYYHLLKSQGPDAAGGAFDYMVDGKMIGGFAVVAWPAQYGNSGIMTFIVNYEGVVYQKDLGDDTESIAKSMTQFNPDSSWHIAQ